MRRAATRRADDAPLRCASASRADAAAMLTTRSSFRHDADASRRFRERRRRR